MSRIRREIPAVKIEYACDRCQGGVYRLIDKRPVTTAYILKWQHRCTRCGDLADFAVPYPLIEVDGKPVNRVFIQRDALPVPTGPSSRALRIGNEARPEPVTGIWHSSDHPYKLPLPGEIC